MLEQLSFSAINPENAAFLVSKKNLSSHLLKNIVDFADANKISYQKAYDLMREEDGDSAREKLGAIKE